MSMSISSTDQLPVLKACGVAMLGVVVVFTEVNDASGHYNEALARSGFSEKIYYIPPIPGNRVKKKRKRHRNVCWYNPPYSMDVSTPVARSFLALVRKHFPPQHRYYKIFNVP